MTPKELAETQAALSELKRQIAALNPDEAPYQTRPGIAARQAELKLQADALGEAVLAHYRSNVRVLLVVGGSAAKIEAVVKHVEELNETESPTATQVILCDLNEPVKYIAEALHACKPPDGSIGQIEHSSWWNIQHMWCVSKGIIADAVPPPAPTDTPAPTLVDTENLVRRNSSPELWAGCILAALEAGLALDRVASGVVVVVTGAQESDLLPLTWAIPEFKFGTWLLADGPCTRNMLIGRINQIGQNGT